MSDTTLTQPDAALPEELRGLVELLHGCGSYVGGNQNLAVLIGERIGRSVHPKGLKQQMNKWRYALEQLGVGYWNRQPSNKCIVEISFFPAQRKRQTAEIRNCGAFKKADRHR